MWLINKKRIGIDNGTIKEIFELTKEGIKKTTEASKLNTFEDDETSPVELLTINCCMNQIHGFGKARNGDLIFPMTIIG